MNKVEAPSLLLEDFNYLFNKAIYQYINKKYNIYDANQQSTDDVRVLKATVVLPVAPSADRYKGAGSEIINSPGSAVVSTQSAYDQVKAANALYGATYEVALPQDYLHILNCVCLYKVNRRFKCYNQGSYVQFAAKRLTADMWGQVINNFYMRPTYKHPYYYIHNVNANVTIPTNPYAEPAAYATGYENDAVTNNTSLKYNWQVGLGTSDVTDGGYSVTSNGTPNPHIGNAVKLVTSSTTGDDAATPSLTSTTGNDATGTIGVSKGKLVYAPYTPSETTYYISGITESKGSTAYTLSATESDGIESVTGTPKSNFPRTITVGSNSIDMVERDTAVRYGNTSSVRMEIRYGKDDSLFRLVNVYVDYLKTPQNIRLTQEQLDLTEDTSQIMEFPDYVCQEIINELTKLVMENSSDPRLQTNIPVNQTIASPAQEQPQPQSRRR